MPRTLPVGTRNQWFQRVEALGRNRTKRRREGLFVVEGVRSINQLSASHEWEIEAFLYAPSRALSEWARETLAGSRAEWHLELDVSLMEELSDRDDASELLAVARIPDDDLTRLAPASSTPLFVLLDQPSRPGNLGSVIRSCDGLGVDGVVVFGRAADLYDPHTVRAAAGSLFTCPVVRIETWGTLKGWLDGLRSSLGGFHLVGTTAHEGTCPEEIDLSSGTVLAFGNETSGLGYKLSELCDAHVSIPMTGSATSLNLACAATAVLYEASRQRRAALAGPTEVGPS